MFMLLSREGLGAIRGAKRELLVFARYGGRGTAARQCMKVGAAELDRAIDVTSYRPMGCCFAMLGRVRLGEGAFRGAAPDGPHR